MVAVGLILNTTGLLICPFVLPVISYGLVRLLNHFSLLGLLDGNYLFDDLGRQLRPIVNSSHLAVFREYLGLYSRNCRSHYSLDLIISCT